MVGGLGGDVGVVKRGTNRMYFRNRVICMLFDGNVLCHIKAHLW